jgi:hypothetical protein
MLCVLGEKCVGSVGSVIYSLSSPCEFVVSQVMCVSVMFVLHNSGRIKKGALEGGRSGYLWVKLRGDCGGQGGNGMGLVRRMSVRVMGREGGFGVLLNILYIQCLVRPGKQDTVRAVP